MATRAVTVNDVLDGHVGLDLECFDRIYLNGWVPNLQVPGQVVSFLTRHLGFLIPSPAILERIGLRFRKAVAEFAADNGIPVVRFAKGQRKLEVMRPYLDRLAPEGRTGVAAVGVAQEFQRVFTGTTYHSELLPVITCTRWLSLSLSLPPPASDQHYDRACEQMHVH